MQLNLGKDQNVSKPQRRGLFLDFLPWKREKEGEGRLEVEKRIGRNSVDWKREGRRRELERGAETKNRELEEGQDFEALRDFYEEDAWERTESGEEEDLNTVAEEFAEEPKSFAEMREEMGEEAWEEENIGDEEDEMVNGVGEGCKGAEIVEMTEVNIKNVRKRSLDGIVRPTKRMKKIVETGVLADRMIQNKGVARGLAMDMVRGGTRRPVVKQEMEERDVIAMGKMPESAGMSMKEKLAEIEERRQEEERLAQLALAERQLLAMKRLKHMRMLEQKAEQEQRELEEKARLEAEARELAEKQKLAKMREIRERPNFINKEVKKRPLSAGRVREVDYRTRQMPIPAQRINTKRNVGQQLEQREMIEKERQLGVFSKKKTERVEKKEIAKKSFDARPFLLQHNNIYNDKKLMDTREKRGGKTQNKQTRGSLTRQEETTARSGAGVVVVPALVRKTVNMPMIMVATVLAGAVVGVLAYFMLMAE